MMDLRLRCYVQGIQNANDHINLETFVFEDDEVVVALLTFFYKKNQKEFR